MEQLKNILLRGKAAEQINILGDDGVSIDTHLVFWKAEICVDESSCRTPSTLSMRERPSMKRQKYMVDKILEVTGTNLSFG